jgi:hypothetical protein
MPTNHGTPPPGEYPSPKGDIINYPTPSEDSAKAGYEMTDVNAGGIVVFLGGLFGFVIIFFFFCFLMGRVINTGLEQSYAEDYGKTDKWHTQNNIFAGAKANNGKREDLKSNAAIEQQQLQKMTTAFPGPRLQTDDGNDDTASLHAREDLLLDHYSSVPGEPLRIPIDRAMEIIAQQGLPVAQPSQSATQLAYDTKPVVTAPLTDGFARTGYELDQMEARRQRLEFGKAEGAEHAELKPVK